MDFVFKLKDSYVCRYLPSCRTVDMWRVAKYRSWYLTFISICSPSSSLIEGILNKTCLAAPRPVVWDNWRIGGEIRDTFPIHQAQYYHTKVQCIEKFSQYLEKTAGHQHSPSGRWLEKAVMTGCTPAQHSGSARMWAKVWPLHSGSSTLSRYWTH